MRKECRRVRRQTKREEIVKDVILHFGQMLGMRQLSEASLVADSLRQSQMSNIN